MYLYMIECSSIIFCQNYEYLEKKNWKKKFWTQFLLESDSIKIWVSNLNFPT